MRVRSVSQCLRDGTSVQFATPSVQGSCKAQWQKLPQGLVVAAQIRSGQYMFPLFVLVLAAFVTRNGPCHHRNEPDAGHQEK